MEIIDIQTSHNIVLSFPLAGVGQRIGAFMIDLTLIYFLSIFSVLIFQDVVILYILLVPFWTVYHLFCEAVFNGQSIGKKILKLRVVSLQSKHLDLKSILIRWSFRLVDIALGQGVVAVFMIISSSRNQRLGDTLARTAVISLSKKNYQSLERINSVSQIAHKVTYPQVAAYNDNDIVIVKETMLRLKRNPTPEIEKFARKLARKLDQELGITNRPKKLSVYFKVLVEDYVMLSR